MLDLLGKRPATTSVTSSRTPEAPNGNAPYYVSIDGTQVDILAHARLVAQDNLPATNAKELNDAERAIAHEHQRRHRDVVERTRASLQSLGAEFDRLDRDLPTPRTLEVGVREAMAAIDRDLATDTSLTTLLRQRGRRHRDLRGVVSDHQVAREPEYPESRVLHLSWLAPIVLVESLFNAAFLAPASTWGLVGGFFIAISISVVNATAGVLAGYFPLRWRHRREPQLRRLGTAGMMAWLLFALAFNLAVACYRDTAASGTAEHLGFLALLGHAASLSLPSLGLLIVGLLATGLAARKGFTTDDIVPRLGHAHRAFTAADQEFATGHDRLRQSVVGHADGIPEQTRTIVHSGIDKLHRMRQIITEAERVVEAYEAERERIERWCHQWMRKYRAVNESVRTNPAPAYFADYPEFPSQVDRSVIDRLTAKLGRASERLEELEAAAHSIGDRQPEFVAQARERFEAFLEQARHLAESDPATDGGGRVSAAAEDRS